MGEAMEQPPLAKNKNLPVANTTQPNANVGKLKEERFHRPLNMSPMWRKGWNNEPSLELGTSLLWAEQASTQL